MWRRRWNTSNVCKCGRVSNSEIILEHPPLPATWTARQLSCKTHLASSNTVQTHLDLPYTHSANTLNPSPLSCFQSWNTLLASLLFLSKRWIAESGFLLVTSQMSHLCNLKLCATGNHSIFPMSRFNSQASVVWQKGIIGKTAAIWGSIEENMELGRKTAFLFGGRSELEVVNAALYENCCSLPQLSRQWDIVEQRGT